MTRELDGIDLGHGRRARDEPDEMVIGLVDDLIEIDRRLGILVGLSVILS